MGAAFSSSKILAQPKLLAQLDGQELAAHRNFSMAKKAARKPKPEVEERPRQPLRSTFIKQWRKKKGWNQAKLAEAIGVSIATISQIENRETGYKQEYLEGIAVALGCEPADLLVRDPNDPEAIWSLWESASPAQRKQIIGIIKGLLSSEAA